MTEFYATAIFLFVLFALLGGSVWIGLALMGVAWVGMELFTSRPAGDAMITTIWTTSSSWTLPRYRSLSGWVRFFTGHVCPKICFEGLRPGCAGCPVVCFTRISQAVPSSPQCLVHRRQH